MMNLRFSLFYLACAIVAFLGCVLVAHDSAQQVNALVFLQPLVERMSQFAMTFSTTAHPWYGYGAVAVLGVLLILWVPRVSRAQRLSIVGVAFATIGQLFLADHELGDSVGRALAIGDQGKALFLNMPQRGMSIALGAFGYIVAILFFLSAARGKDGAAVLNRWRDDDQTFGGRDFAVLGAIFLMALVLRMYALNFILNNFDGELSPYSAGATSLRGMFYANRGVHGPWAPLGILYYLPIYFTTSFFGTNLVALRLSSAIVGLLTLPLLYMLATRIGGRLAGHLAAALFALNCLHIGWSRTDVHPHGVTTWPTVLMCWCLLKAYDSRSIFWSSAVAILMGLSWHQYPSGQSAVVAPLIAIGWYAIANRGSLPIPRAHLALILVGIGLWVIGLPGSYYFADGRFELQNMFNLTGPRASWGGVESASIFTTMSVVLKTSLKHLGEVLQGLFYHQPYFFHQEWVPAVSASFARTVVWMAMPFVVFGSMLLLRQVRSFESAVMGGWLIAALLPGILSSHAYPKRLSTFYPALDIIGALGLAALVYFVSSGGRLWARRLVLSSIVVAFLSYFLFLTNVWFSGRFWRYGEPSEARVAAQIAESITPGTIVIADLNRGYESGKMLYLLLDHLVDRRNRPNLWLAVGTSHLRDLAANPSRGAEMFTSTWPYLWTKLRSQVTETSSFSGWSRVVFMIQTGTPTQYPNDDLIALAASRCKSPTRHTIQVPYAEGCDLVVISCNVSDLTS